MQLITCLILLIFFNSNNTHGITANAVIKQNENLHTRASEIDNESVLIFIDGILQSSIRGVENIPFSFRVVNHENKCAIHPLFNSSSASGIAFYFNSIRRFNTSPPIYISLRVLLI